MSTCDYDFEDELFDVVSSEAKDFIEKLLIRTPRYVVDPSHCCVCVCVCVCVRACVCLICSSSIYYNLYPTHLLIT